MYSQLPVKLHFLLLGIMCTIYIIYTFTDGVRVCGGCASGLPNIQCRQVVCTYMHVPVIRRLALSLMDFDFLFV